MGQWSPVQHAIECTDHAAPAKGAYKLTAASRHTHVASTLLRSWLEAFTFPVPYDA